ncbi:MAG: helix-turn-helix domain-containing protein [Candidatus Avispirillum sp.]
MDDRIEAVQRMQDYIEKHLREEISAADLARAAGFSPWYARRLFALFTGLAPSDYIRRLRLRNSALRLRDENCRITDVAFDMGFGSVDGYTRAFAHEFGCNPKKYAKSPVPLQLFTPYGVKYQHIKRRDEKMKEARTVFVQMVEKPVRKAIIKRGVKATEYFSYCREVGCDVWGVLTSIKSLCGEPVCMWLPHKYIKGGTSEYVQGVEVPCDYDGEVPEGYDVIEIPAAKYLMFRGEPFREEDFEAAIAEIQNAEKKYDPALAGFQWDSENPKIQLEPVGTRGYIELLPVKELKIK